MGVRWGINSPSSEKKAKGSARTPKATSKGMAAKSLTTRPSFLNRGLLSFVVIVTAPGFILPVGFSDCSRRRRAGVVEGVVELVKGH